MTDEHGFRPAFLWGGAAAVAGFFASYAGGDAGVAEALMWAGFGGLLVGLFFARLLGWGSDRSRRRPK